MFFNADLLKSLSEDISPHKVYVCVSRTGFVFRAIAYTALVTYADKLPVTGLVVSDRFLLLISRPILAVVLLFLIFLNLKHCQNR